MEYGIVKQGRTNGCLKVQVCYLCIEHLQAICVNLLTCSIAAFKIQHKCVMQCFGKVLIISPPPCLYFQGKKCAVIGGCGFLGRHIVEKLLERGYTVNVFDIRSTFDDERISFFVGDLCNKEVQYFYSYLYLTICTSLRVNSKP